MQVLKDKLGQDFEMINEPVNRWINIGSSNMNMLDNLYKVRVFITQDPQRWSYTFESLSLLTKLQLWDDI